MTELEFVEQMRRLEKEWPKAFGFERLVRIKEFVMDLSGYAFERIISHMLDNFRAPPLPINFKEAAVAERKNDPRSVPKILRPDFKGDNGLQRVLERDYPGCKTLTEAFEVRKIQRRIEKADDKPEPIFDNKNSRCKECDGDGYLSAIRRVDGRAYSYAFRCPSNACPAASNVPSNYPQWSKNYEPEFSRS